PGKKLGRCVNLLNFDTPPLIVLSYLDSNQDRQNQKLQCYHYTIRQSLLPKASARADALKRCKFSCFPNPAQYPPLFFTKND
ncbi:MAG: hypothetical protein Q4F93_09885, partial [bacterium]|nr:hypothetical protein [bacterium]